MTNAMYEYYVKKYGKPKGNLTNAAKALRNRYGGINGYRRYLNDKDKK